VEVDRYQIENAILNMDINARDAMAGAGRLTIALHNLSGADQGDREGGQVCLAISDTGCGMPPEVLAKIYDPFYTTKAPGKGTGLGMSMVYGFVKQSGGEIKIESSPGPGTTIRICLPRAHAAAVADDALEHAGESGHGETILVVDDDPAVVAGTVAILDSLGYRPLSAGDGQAAVEILTTGVPVDLLFSDLSMPGAVDCAALVARCRAIAPGTAILLTSGHRPDTPLDEGIELLPKPYSRAQLARAVRQRLGSPAPAAAASPMAAAASDESCRILVVEDDPDTRELACELLAALGHKASGSGSAEQALVLLRERDVDILFTDLNLPGLSGIELATRAIAAQPSLKVILASGDGKHVQVPSSAITLLPKPYDLVQLQLSIAQAAMAAPPAIEQ
jgi:CheY-like chemotaxis protein